MDAGAEAHGAAPAASDGDQGALVAVGAPMAYAVVALGLSFGVLFLAWFVLYRCLLVRKAVFREIMGIGEHAAGAASGPASKLDPTAEGASKRKSS
mmetsp:Transcript_17498/g.40966  ORF Transcript_17498/g.40966 Transcript_17498/m.40966 type:complete len:96 (+) Transcript_17498:184-471(+)